MILYANGDQNQAEVAIFISDKTDFMPKTVIRDSKDHYIKIKESIHHIR